MENTVYFARTDAPSLSVQVRHLLAYALGYHPDLATGVHGKPYLVDRRCEISLTHTQGAVACALSENPVGIDLEHPRKVNPKLSVRFLTEREQAKVKNASDFLRIWTCKEALLKREGNGMAVPLNRLETVDHPDIVTICKDAFILSFCGSPAQFRLVEVEEYEIMPKLF